MTIIKTQERDYKGVYFKLGLICLLLLIGVGSYMVAAKKKIGTDKSVVLGQKTTQQSPNTKDVLQSVQTAADQAKNNVYTNAQNAFVAVGDMATSSATVVKTYILDTTVGSAVKQLDNLPVDAREKIREYICK